jgi:hypothetical protein
MLTEETTVDDIRVTENGIVLVRRAIYVVRDGVRSPQPTYHRTSYTPGADLTHEDARVQAIAAAAWTDAVVRAYHAQQAVALHQLTGDQHDET